MTKNNMFGVWLKTMALSGIVAATLPVFGQQNHATTVPAAAEVAPADAFNPRQGEWKIENGTIFIMEPGKAWVPVGNGEATLENAVKALTVLYTDATFALDPRLAKTKVGDLVDRATDPTSDLKALRVATSGAFDINFWNKVFSLEPGPGSVARGSGRDERTVECFNLQGYFSHLPSENGDAHRIAIDKALNQLREVIHHTIQSLDPSLGQPDFEYFAEGQILIATGPNQSLLIANRVIHALPGMDKTFSYSGERRQAPVGGFGSGSGAMGYGGGGGAGGYGTGRSPFAGSDSAAQPEVHYDGPVPAPAQVPAPPEPVKPQQR